MTWCLDSPSIVRQTVSRFNARGTELTVRLLPPAVEDNQDAITHFQTSVNDLFDYALRNVDDTDMVGVTIHNEVNLLRQSESVSDGRTSYRKRQSGLYSVR